LRLALSVLSKLGFREIDEWLLKRVWIKGSWRRRGWLGVLEEELPSELFEKVMSRIRKETSLLGS